MHTFSQHSGIVKTHNLGFQECETLQAVFTKELCPNHIKVQSRSPVHVYIYIIDVIFVVRITSSGINFITFRTLSEVVLNFPTSLEEVTVAAEPEKITMKNYVEEDSKDTSI